MKRIAIIAGLILLSLAASSQKDKIVGCWLTSEGESQIRIFRATNGKYYGKIVWQKEEEDKEKKDTKNPDEKLRDRKILGIQLINSFIYNQPDKRWENGTIYDPDNGKTYDCYMWFDDDPDILFIKGYVLGMKFLGRQTKWTRELSVRE
jgi:uncharacterized protein (DUF2147 family)